MAAYYNEFDSDAAAVLRDAIARGLIPGGEVDERDIRDVAPAELVRFTQCHFFAGIGIWPLALRRAGWPDERPIWTGSCPCQPFSAAGKGLGFDDERHLWPAWHWLIENVRPPVVAGEQVAGNDGLGWLDLVSDDLGGIGYAMRAGDICAAGFGVGWRGSTYAERLERALRDCPDPLVARQLGAFADWADQALAIGGFHRRQRHYFGAVDDTLGERFPEGRGSGDHGQHDGPKPRPERQDGSVADDASPRREGRQDARADRASEGELDPRDAGGPARHGGLAEHSPARGMDDSEREGLERHAGDGGRAPGRIEGEGRSVAAPGVPSGLADIDGRELGHERIQRDGEHGRESQDGRDVRGRDSGPRDQADRGMGPDPGERGRLDIDWLFCRDGFWRAVEAGTFPLANAYPGRPAQLRVIGNALDFETATAFARALKGSLDNHP